MIKSPFVRNINITRLKQNIIWVLNLKFFNIFICHIPDMMQWSQKFLNYNPFSILSAITMKCMNLPIFFMVKSYLL